MSKSKPNPSIWRFLAFMAMLPYWIFRAAADKYWKVKFEEWKDQEPRP